MRYQLLGPLQVVRDGQAVELGPPKQRAVLAVLLLASGAVVSVDRLIDAVWGDDVPGSATASLHAYISNLRRALRSDSSVAAPIVRRAPGYYLALTDADTVDISEFTALCAQARRAAGDGDWRSVLEAADAALERCQGGLLDDLADAEWVGAEALRVGELRTECREHRISALLAVGRSGEALADATALRAAEPLRDRACWLHMLTLYRSGRGAEALDAYTDYAAHLDAELGLEPGPELRELQTLILQQSAELATWPRSPAWSGGTDVPTPAAPEPAPAETAESGTVTALVGRDRELGLLATVLDDAARGLTRWLMLTGPAGIGKTRLAEEAAARAGAGGADVIWVSCPDERGTPPWWPIRQLVRALGADADAVLQVPDDADPDAARFLVYERIQQLLQVSRPVVAIIDDAQWADTTSLGALGYLAGTLRDCSVAVVVTVRDGENPAGLQRLLATVARGDGNRHIAVPALSAADVETLANEIADDAAGRIGETEAAELAERTGGNPFFVSEYARLPRAERATGDIPSAIRSVLDRRIGTLEPAVLEVLRATAVIGEVIDTRAIGLLAATTRLDLDTLADRLDDAADERILVLAHGGAGYEFAHGLLRDHLLAGIPPLRRQRLHATVADHLADDPSPENAGRRAQHLIAALPLVAPQAVVDACRVAAEQAAAQWSSEIAARWWQAALDAYDLLPAAQRDDTDRDALTVALLRALARSGRGQTVLDAAAAALADALRAGRAGTAGRIAAELLRVSGGWPWIAPGVDPGELLALLQRAVDLVGEDAVADARVRAALAVGQCYHPDPSVSADLLEDAARQAASTRHSGAVADALLGRIITYSGVSTVSRQSLLWVDELLGLHHDRSAEDTVIAHSVATMATFNLADFAATRAHLQAGIVGSEELRLPVLRAQLRWMEAVLAIWHGDFDAAIRHHGFASHSHEQTELYGAGSALLAFSCLQRELGEPFDDALLFDDDADLGGEGMINVARTAFLATRSDDGARAEAAELLRGQRGAAHVWIGLGHVALLAQLCADHQLAEFADELLERLNPHRDEIALVGQVGIAGPVALATARLHALRGRESEARQDLSRAEDIAQRGQGLPSLLRIRLLDLELSRSAGVADVAAVAAQAVALAAEAEAAGMRGVAAAARRLRR